MLGVEGQPGFIWLLMAMNGSPKCQRQTAKQPLETRRVYHTSQAAVRTDQKQLKPSDITLPCGIH